MPAKEEIKVMLARRNLSMRKLVELLNVKFKRNDKVQNISRKLNSDTIRFREVEEIAEALGYKIVFEPDED